MSTVVNTQILNLDIQLKDIIAEKTGYYEAAITKDSQFKDDLGIDSLDFCEILMEVEKKFEIQIPDEEAEKIRTVGSLVAYVEWKTN